jgi:hypothetical protein
MSARLKRATKELDALGKKRQTEFEQREFLMDLASEFQEIAALAINANYGRSTFFANNLEQDEYGSLRLATVAMERGEGFAKVMNEAGHEISFGGDGDEDDKTSADEQIGYKARRLKTPDDIVDILPDFDLLGEPLSEDIVEWIESVFRNSRGFEIATFDPSLVSMMMKEQARKWEALALGYISDIICLIHSFILRLVQHIAAEHAGVSDRLSSLFLDKLRAKYEAALQHAAFLLKVELEGIPATYNPEFKEELTEWFVLHYIEHLQRRELTDHSRNRRLKKLLAGKAVYNDNVYTDLVRLEDITSIQNKNDDSLIILEIYDTLYAYYHISRKRFVDNIRMQVADHFLVIGPDTPLRLFSPKYVASLTADQLEEIAGEDLSVKRQRAEVEKEIERMKKGRQILQ